MTRREMLLTSAAATAAAASTAQPIRLGGPIFVKSDDPAELARAHRALGYSAAYCPAVKPGDTARAKAIEKAFAAENVVIAEVGVWVNLLDPDAEARKTNIKKVIDGLAIADEVGARCCVDIAGSYNPKVWYGPDPRNLSKDFFDASVENARKIIDAVQPKRTTFTYEMMGWNLPDSADSYLKMIRAIDRKPFAVHIDVCNCVNSPVHFYENAALIKDLFSKLGPHIRSCHAKDLDWIPEMNIHFVEVIPGRGKIDYQAYLTSLTSLQREVPLMLEHLKSAEDYEEGKRYIQKVAAGLNLKFA